MNNYTPENRRGKPKAFVAWALSIFILLFVFLSFFEAVPLGVRELNNALFSVFIHENIPDSSSGGVQVGEPVSEIQLSGPTFPVRIVIPKIKVDGPINNPTQTTIAALDRALLTGAVRYPGSGVLGESKNIFIFGHSSGLPVVHNENFKIFNRLKELNVGDEIQLAGKERLYRYKVTSVAVASADEALVDLSVSKRQLVLSTCNAFGKKEERFVVYADLIDSRTLAK